MVRKRKEPEYSSYWYTWYINVPFMLLLVGSMFGFFLVESLGVSNVLGILVLVAAILCLVGAVLVILLGVVRPTQQERRRRSQQGDGQSPRLRDLS